MNGNKKSEAMALWAVQIPKPEKRSQGSREQPTHDGAQPHKRVAALHARVRSLQSENKHKIEFAACTTPISFHGKRVESGT